MRKILVNDTEIQVIKFEEEDYISLTDMVRNIENGVVLIEKWLRNKNTIEFPRQVTKQQTAIVYASEADVLNVALFGKTAKEWREQNAEKKGNIRDYATVNELICLSNLESLNAVFIEDGLPQKERLVKLNGVAIHQMIILEEQEAHLYLK